MSEEEILEKINWAIHVNEMTKSINGDNTHINVNVLQGLLDLYNKEKEKNKELQEYANWHIEHLTEDIADYIDDDRKGNASIIGEFKEEREHWKDIIRIINNEKTYIDYKNY